MPGIPSYPDLTEAGVTTLTAVSTVVHDAQGTPTTKEMTLDEQRKLFYRYASADPAREFKAITLTGGSPAVSTPMINSSQTWTQSGVDYVGWNMAITNTASGAASKFWNCEIGTTKVFALYNSAIYCQNSGKEIFMTAATSPPGIYTQSTSMILMNASQGLALSTTAVTVSNSQAFAFCSNNNVYQDSETRMYRDTNYTIGCRNGTNPHAFRVWKTWTSATNGEWVETKWVSDVATIGTNKGTGGGTARDLALATDDTVRLTFGAAGSMTITDANNVAVGTTTGTKIGTATGQKLGFWNATPVVQQVLATGAGATVDNVISLLQTLGLCKQA